MQYRLRLVKDSNNRVAAIPTVNSESTPSHAPQLDALSTASQTRQNVETVTDRKRRADRNMVRQLTKGKNVPKLCYNYIPTHFVVAAHW